MNTNRFSFKKILFLLLCIILASLLIFLFLVRALHDKEDKPTNTNGDSLQQNPLIVSATNPTDGQSDVFPGEVKILISFNQELFSQDIFNVQITPQPLAGFEVLDSFPSREVTLQIFGGLTPSTLHTISVNDSSGKNIYNWSFTTSDKIPESSSGEINRIQQQTVKDYYPLFDHVPYRTNLFIIDYIDRLTLEVRIKGTKTPQIENDVENWIRVNNVDPSTHTINYIEQ